MYNKIESFDHIFEIIPIIKAAIPADMSIAVCDLEKFIAYYPGETIDLKIKVGQTLNSDEPLKVALDQNKRLQSNVPAEFYGIEFTGTAMPLHDQNGKVMGGIAVQIRRQTELREIAGHILESLSLANEQILSVANGSNLLAEYSQDLLGKSQQAEEKVKNSDDVLAIIKKVADETNLLGLNAAIEAAHAGEKGKGFEVVANEIRKFSKETVASTKKIRETLAQIQSDTKQMGLSIEEIAAVGQEQAAAIQHTSSFIEEIKDLSKRLHEFADKL